jgi:hypothetical protein
MAMKPRAMKKKTPMRGGGMPRKMMKEGGAVAEPAWLKSLKKEADKLGVPLRELLTMYEKGKDPKKETMKAAKGGMAKKTMMMRGGMAKKKK